MFVAKYIVEQTLRARDVVVSDSFRNRRGWKSISRKDVKLTAPWISVSAAAATFLSRYIEIVLEIDNLEQVKITDNGKIYVSDPTPDCLDRHRALGSVDDLLRDFVKRWNGSADRAFSERP